MRRGPVQRHLVLAEEIGAGSTQLNWSTWNRISDPPLLGRAVAGTVEGFRISPPVIRCGGPDRGLRRCPTAARKAARGRARRSALGALCRPCSSPRHTEHATRLRAALSLTVAGRLPLRRLPLDGKRRQRSRDDHRAIGVAERPRQMVRAPPTAPRSAPARSRSPTGHPLPLRPPQTRLTCVSYYLRKAQDLRGLSQHPRSLVRLSSYST